MCLVVLRLRLREQLQSSEICNDRKKDGRMSLDKRLRFVALRLRFEEMGRERR